MAPLRRLMLEYSDRLSGATTNRIVEAVEFAAKLEKAGAKYFGENASVDVFPFILQHLDESAT